MASQDGVGRGEEAGLLQGRGGQSGGRTRASAAPSSESLFIHLMQTHVDPACSMITMFYEKNSGPGWQETESEGLSGLVAPLVEQTLSDSSTAAERRGGG